MKQVISILFLCLGIGACGNSGLGGLGSSWNASEQDLCAETCSKVYIKESNKCDVDHMGDDSTNRTCNSAAGDRYTLCTGKCYGNV